jgi:hypothetical protein
MIAKRIILLLALPLVMVFDVALLVGSLMFILIVDDATSWPYTPLVIKALIDD